jgi:erythrocyte membrane protein band 4.1
MTYALLGSYLVQSLLGDSPRLSSNSKTVSQSSSANYLQGIARFAQPTDVEQDSELLERIAELHTVHRGMSPGEAEMEYLRNASKLAMYGVEMHPVQVAIIP